MKFHRHKPYRYMTPSFKEALYASLERYWGRVYGRRWKEEYNIRIPALTQEIRRYRAEQLGTIDG